MLLQLRPEEREDFATVLETIACEIRKGEHTKATMIELYVKGGENG